jgi:hypothetical protein
VRSGIGSGAGSGLLLRVCLLAVFEPTESFDFGFNPGYHRVVELPRINRTSVSMDSLSPDGRLNDVSIFITNLITDLPKRVSQQELFQDRPVPARLATLREVQRYRMAELSSEALRCLQSKQGVAAAVLVRAAFETAAVLFYIENLVRKAVEDDALGDVGEMLLRVIVGSKHTTKESEASPEPRSIEAINTLSMIKQVEKKYSGFAKEYDYLCEIAHPNQLGALVAFGKIEASLDVELATKPSFGNQFCPTLCIALALFEYHYNRIADLFLAFRQLCRRDAPPSRKCREK